MTFTSFFSPGKSGAIFVRSCEGRRSSLRGQNRHPTLGPSQQQFAPSFLFLRLLLFFFWLLRPSRVRVPLRINSLADTRAAPLPSTSAGRPEPLAPGLEQRPPGPCQVKGVAKGQDLFPSTRAPECMDSNQRSALFWSVCSLIDLTSSLFLGPRHRRSLDVGARSEVRPAGPISGQWVKNPQLFFFFFLNRVGGHGVVSGPVSGRPPRQLACERE